MRRKFLPILLCTSVIMSMLTGCGKESQVTSNETQEISTETDSDYTDKIKNSKTIVNDNFIFNDAYPISDEYSVNNSVYLIDYLASNKENSNVVVSEASLNMALSLLLEGANENTESYNALVEYLHNSNYSNTVPLIRQQNNAIMSQYLNNDLMAINMSNSIWGNISFNYSDEYKEIIQNYYNGESQTLDFMDPDSATTINDWVKKTTNGTIPSMITPTILQNSDSVLLNTLYFLGEWDDAFTDDACYPETFTNSNGTTSEVTMMHAQDVGSYYSNDNAEAFMKPYKDSDFVFVGILPKNNEFNVADLDIDSLLKNSTDKYTVNIAMPEFKIDDNNSLYNALNESKLSPIFKPGNNDFNGTMCNSPITITDIIQKTYIDVNRQGTEAAAATAVVSVKSTALDDENIKVIKLNRPFVFMIYDKTNHNVLFIGKINQL